jgi:hypothetical protein
LVWVLFYAGWAGLSNPGEKAIENNFQNLIYLLFGTNLVIGSQIKDQIKMLETRVPASFKGRDMDDLGCGDGKTTLLLNRVFQPKSLRGFDVHPGLIKRANKNGIKAQIKNLDECLPSGELAVMWGVLHHLNDRETCLKRIKENYRMAFIREPIKNKAIKGLEMGQPLIRQEIEGLVQRYFPEAEMFYYGHCIFIFYVAPGTKG